MRRRAWGAERDAGRDEPHIDPAASNTLADLLAVASSAEHCLADNLAALADSHPELEKVGIAMREMLADIEARLDAAGKPGKDAARAIESIENYKRKTASISDDPDALLQRLYADSERCFALYDAVVTHTKDEAVMLAAQGLAELVLDRIALLRDVLKTES
jgi:hypothetical protein